jgi:hypothetical protein
MKTRKPFSSQRETAAATAVEEEPESVERPEKPFRSVDAHSFVSVFDDEQKKIRDMSHVPAGTYKGRIRELVVQEPRNDSLCARLKIVVCDHSQYGGAEIPAWFTLGKYYDGSDGGESGWKINTVARDILYRGLNVLGYEPTTFASLVEICREVTEQELGVTFRLMYRGDNGQFTNVVILQPWEGSDDES